MLSNQASKRVSANPRNQAGLQKSKQTQNKNYKICRICLSESLIDKEDEKIIKSCSCLGSLQYMHENCLLEWVNTIIKKRIQLAEPIDNIACEICKQTLDLTKQKRIVCMPWSHIKYKIHVYWIFFSICIGSVFLAIGGMAALGYAQSNLFNQNTSEQSHTIMIVSWIVLSLILLFWSGRITWNYFLDQQVYVSKVAARQSNHEDPNVYQHPNLYSADVMINESKYNESEIGNQSAQCLQEDHMNFRNLSDERPVDERAG